MERIYMTGYNSESIPDDSLTDGLNFSTDEPFFLICNKPLTGRMYFEFTISSYYPIKSFHNIPIYAGVSKEPSFGVLNADFCIGSLFYKDGEEYDIESKYNATAENYHGFPPHIYTRIPGASDVIGVGVDIYNNLISLYVNGKLFYSFNPPLFNMKDEGNLYFCLWGNTYYKSIRTDNTYRSGDDMYESTKKITGWCNFGKNQLQYLPAGYYSIYGMYYRRTEVNTDIDCDVTVDAINASSVIQDIDSDSSITNEYVGDNRSLYIVSQNDNVEIDNLDYRIYHNDIHDYILYGANVMVNLPIPVERKIYFEFTARSATLKNKDILGIPLSIGVSDTLYSIANYSLRCDLFHEVNHRYNYHETENMVDVDHELNTVESTAVPEQGTIIGVAIDLANNEISIYVDMVLFVTIRSVNTDWSDPSHLAWVFIHDEGLFEDSINGEVNLGQTPFDMTIPDGYISLWDYYNKLPNRFVFADIDIDCIVENRMTSGAYIFCDAYVTHIVDQTTGESKYPRPSINSLMGTYNSVSDTEEHTYVADKDYLYLNKLIAVDNDGYYPDMESHTMNVDFSDDGTVKMYSVNISQSNNQTIYVRYKNVYYTDSFVVEDGDKIEVTVVGANGYTPGTLNITEKEVHENTSIYASDATLTLYTVQIIQTNNQTITVFCNGREYTDTFSATIGQTYRATITANDGYRAGTLSSTGGQISGNVSIYASPAKINGHLIAFTQPEHQKVEVLCNGIVYTSSFVANYGSKLTINVVDVDAGYIANENFERFITVTENITINIPDAVPDVCSITIDYDEDICSARVNGQEGDTFSFRKGTQVTLEIIPKEGYFVSSVEYVED